MCLVTHNFKTIGPRASGTIKGVQETSYASSNGDARFDPGHQGQGQIGHCYIKKLTWTRLGAVLITLACFLSFLYANNRIGHRHWS